MKPYSSYKDSGIAWIGEIPSHWKVLYLFQVADEHYISNKDVHHQNLLSLSYGKIIRKDINKTDGLLPASFDGYQIVEPGNIVLRLTDLQNDQRSLRVGMAEEEGIVTSAYLALQASERITPKYLYFQLHSNDIHKVFYGMGGGLRQGLNWGGLRHLQIILPPIAEQEAIVRFITEKSEKIDRYIAEQERLLAALDELRQAEIARAVTRGLNPDAPLRDSGIDWIGSIPANWKVRKMKFSFTQRSDKNHPNETKLSATQSHGVIPQSMYEDKGNHVVDVNRNFEGLKLVKVGDFVIHLRSFQGGLAYAYYQGVISAAYTILTPIEKDFTDYYRYLFLSYPYIQLLKTCVTGIREGQNIDYGILGNKYIPIPPLAEQRAIVEYLDEKTAKIDRMKADIEKKISYMKEYKQRLISDAVTGKSDVRSSS